MKGRRPVAASYKMQPNEKMSERWSTGLLCACSGDMELGVPTIIPGPVRPSIDVVGVDSAAAASVDSVSFAKPKSTTLG